MIRTCTKCGASKPIEDFYPDRTGRGGRKAKCKACDAVSMRAYRKTRRRDPKRWASDILPMIRGRASERGIPFSISAAEHGEFARLNFPGSS